MMISVLLIMTISLSMISLLRRIPFRQLGLRGLQGRFVTILQGLHTLQNTIKGNLQSEIPVGFGLIPQPLLLPYILLSFFTNAQCLKITEKVSLKVASEASNICQKWSILTSFWKPEAYSQTALPDMSVLGKNCWKCQNFKFKCDIFGDYWFSYTVQYVLSFEVKVSLFLARKFKYWSETK